MRVGPQPTLASGSEAFGKQTFRRLLGGFGGKPDIDGVRPEDVNTAVDCANLAGLVVNDTFGRHLRSFTHLR
jgi:hypothetical protein